MHFLSYKKTFFGMMTTLLVALFVFAPLRMNGTVSRAHAQVPLVGGGILVNDVGNTLTNTLQTIATQALAQKQLVLDPLFYQIAQMALQKLTSNILTFINSGFNGDPAFITDYNSYFKDAENTAAANFIYGSGNFDKACSTEVGQSVQAALSTKVFEQNSYKDKVACTATDPGVDTAAFTSGTFTAGGWATWFEYALHPQNSSLGLYADASQALDSAEQDAKDTANTEALANNGFKSVKTCTSTGGSGGIGQNCTIVTPGSAIAALANFALTTPARDLLNANQINETVGALFSNLATQALSGVNGLLGLGGNASFTTNTFGTDGNSSYLDAVQAQSAQTAQASTQTNGNQIQQALVTETQVLQSQLDIVKAIDDATTAYTDAKGPYASSTCWTLQIPKTLTDTINQYVTQVPKTVQTVVTLQNLSDQYDKATDAATQLQLLGQLTQMQSNGTLQGEAAVVQNGYILNGTITDTITAFKKDIQTQVDSCGS